MKIRHAAAQDLDRMMEIYGAARKFMAEHGNPNQWGPTNWPPEALVHSDIRDGNSYVCVNDAGKVIGTFFFIHGKDIEPTYREITDGAWLRDGPYGVVHRMASGGRTGGVGAFCLARAGSDDPEPVGFVPSRDGVDFIALCAYFVKHAHLGGIVPKSEEGVK